MFAHTKTLVIIAACIVAAQAQSSGSGRPTTTATAPASQSSLPAGLDNCILGCLTQAAPQGNCSSFTDLACVCTSSAFQNAALSCLQANCTSQDVTTAAQLQSQECAGFASGSSAPAPTGSSALSPVPSGSSPTPVTSSPGSTSAPSGSTGTSSGAPSPTTSNAAMGLPIPFSFETVFGTLFASAGALLGAAFVL